MKQKKEEQKSNISICSLLDADAKVRTFFDVEADRDEKFQILYFFIYDIKDKKKRRMSDIVVNYVSRKEDLINLIKFLRNWNFSINKENADLVPRFWLDCNCLSDAFRFVKTKKEVQNEKEDHVYIDFFSSGGNFKKNQTIEANITRDQAEVLANQLENFLVKIDQK